MSLNIKHPEAHCLAIGRDCAERLARAELPEHPDELLFDERGLPHDAGR